MISVTSNKSEILNFFFFLDPRPLFFFLPKSFISSFCFSFSGLSSSIPLNFICFGFLINLFGVALFLSSSTTFAFCSFLTSLFFSSLLNIIFLISSFLILSLFFSSSFLLLCTGVVIICLCLQFWVSLFVVMLFISGLFGAFLLFLTTLIMLFLLDFIYSN